MWAFSISAAATRSGIFSLVGVAFAGLGWIATAAMWVGVGAAAYSIYGCLKSVYGEVT